MPRIAMKVLAQNWDATASLEGLQKEAFILPTHTMSGLN